MGKSLVIVESPAKAKTINKYLGNNFIVKSSVGHIRDLPTAGSGKKAVDPKARAKATAALRNFSPEERNAQKKKKAKEQLVGRMGIDPDNDWAAHYEILPGKEKVVDELRRLAASADTIYLATDLDREGEAIAWHLSESIGGDETRFRRVVFNEITRNAIQSAFEEPGYINQDRVNAQQARRFLDRVVGYMVSPLLWSKIARGLSAGRVQSVAVRLVVDREREIRRFTPEEYWELHANLLTGSGDTIRFQVVKENGSGFRPVSEEEMDVALKVLKASNYCLTKREDKPTKSKPSAPFITSSLQQAASTRLSFSAKKTMMVAQRLYEAGHITYMRTDSTSLSAYALDAVRKYIGDNYSSQYLPDEPNRYSNKKGAQEAHEAIRPSDVSAKSGDLNMERDAERLYDLIWRQFVACQMVPAEYLNTRFVIDVDGFMLKAAGRIMKFDGFTKVQTPLAKKGEDNILPQLNSGDQMSLDHLDPKQLFTRPSARFSEASLIKELEKCGIGRPSTYVPIISTIQDRGYVSVKNRRFYAEKIGDIVTDRLVESFSDLMDFNFTANMEENLDAVAEGSANWKAVLDDFYGDFLDRLETASEDEGGMRANTPSPTDISCPSCDLSMVIRTASTGVFLGCSGYALPPKERCKTTINLVLGEEAEVDDEFIEVNALRAMRRCPKCSTAMENYLIDEDRKLHICGNNPDCPGYYVENGSFKIKGYDGPVLECDKCGAEMQLKTGRFGKYFGCTNSDECKNTRKLLRSGEAAPPKMDPVPMVELKCVKVDDHYILRDGASGLFLAASQFPKNRETRAPKVAEILSHQGAIDSKYNYLFDAPCQDPEGNPAIIRYSRKSKQQFVMSEVNGKATGWSATYDGAKWTEASSKKSKKS